MPISNTSISCNWFVFLIISLYQVVNFKSCKFVICKCNVYCYTLNYKEIFHSKKTCKN